MKNHIFNRDVSSIIIGQICKNILSRKIKKIIKKKAGLLDHESRDFNSELKVSIKNEKNKEVIKSNMQ